MHKASALIERAKRLIYDSPYCVYYLDHSLTHMTPEHTYNIIYLTSVEINKTVILFTSYLQWHDVENLVVYILILALFFNFLWRFSQFRFWVDCEFFVCVCGGKLIGVLWTFFHWYLKVTVLFHVLVFSYDWLYDFHGFQTLFLLYTNLYFIFFFFFATTEAGTMAPCFYGTKG